MNEAKKELINKMNLSKLGYDFMGYTFQNIDNLDFHHLIIARKDCVKMGIDRGYYSWNGALLTRDTSHRYLHFIEKIDREIFCLITRQMIEENLGGKITIEHLKKIREYLLYFEDKHQKEIEIKSPKIIKPTYFSDRINL